MLEVTQKRNHLFFYDYTAMNEILFINFGRFGAKKYVQFNEYTAVSHMRHQFMIYIEIKNFHC